ncbi:MULTISPECIES: ABC transporter ATP-binding protein [unclassified Bradyrhizobium]|uniref:ABC transporter ATP-binding protein n=1 Tax=unclassified Bradyrhizobium TaxID=2631580 RepID=UPI001BAD2FE5|nr:MULTISPECIES: ABC transporter ATP-binding protein [unclassified Bradyrhizobium]MBR1205614.1 ABC transporter ATP-binding protein [Bradyrhizobium sp. AUGA SZCCT0124]MBR1313937.1 ABC transporter ATP-binding protein [Bradyrhizobium sp. AUGA SZCCT0051]MBR1337941.1 ABC transporter ATP-binding protein [Bradyrhizobium sp. AUGA SZCCT0105]MBR1355596.1 ABC transporter ATP-binding protein [Bradyrhizobium sp. AUGA SZCCT0045]
MSAGLTVQGLDLARNGKAVLHGIDLALAPGRITALLGANGAGKSSLVLAIAGVLPATSGEITLNGRSIRGLRPEAIRASGLAAVPEGHQVLNELSVEDNLKVAGSHLSRAEMRSAIEVALGTFPELRERLQARSGNLSGGQQQMVALAQAIIAKPRYLLADELSFGLAPVVVARLVPVLQDLAAQGVGVLLIEQFTHIALKIAHAVYVMERGKICFSGEPRQLIDNPAILHSAYLA